MKEHQHHSMKWYGTISSFMSVFLWAHGTALLAQNQRFLYVSNWDASSNSISGFSVNPTTGLLTPLAGFPIPGHNYPGKIAVHPNNRFLYVEAQGAHGIYGYQIDPSTGSLSEINSSPFFTGASGTVIIDPTGRFAYVPSFYAPSNSVFGFSIDPNSGALTPISGSPFPAQGDPNLDEPGGAAIDPAGKFLYTANGRSISITAYAIDQTTGALSFVPGSPFRTPNSGGIGIGTIDPTGRFFYAVDSYMSTVDAWTIGPNGSLIPVPGSPFPTGPFAGSIAGYPTTMAIDRTGRLAYVTNEGASSVAIYTIDKSSGALNPISGSPISTGPATGPTAFTFSADGTLAYIANQQNGSLSVYSINQSNGTITPIPSATFPTGTQPVAIAVVNANLPPLITPTHGGNSGTVTVSIRGSNFDDGTQVTLVSNGSPDIVASNVTVLSSSLLSATFDLTAATPGPRSAVVINPAQAQLEQSALPTVATSIGSFLIDQGGASSLSMSILGSNKIRFNKNQPYIGEIQNLGNVDANNVAAYITQTGGQTTTFFGTVPALSSVSLPLTATGPSSASPNSCPAASIPILGDAHIVSPSDPCTTLQVARAAAQGYLLSLYTRRLSNVLLLLPSILPTSKGGTGFCFNPSNPASIASCDSLIASDVGLDESINAVASGQKLLCVLAALIGCPLNCGDPTPNNITALSGIGQGTRTTIKDLKKLFASASVLSDQLAVLDSQIALFETQAVALPDTLTFPPQPVQQSPTALPPDQTASLTLCGVGSLDPNSKTGPLGVGAAQYVSGKSSIPYIVSFENSSTATAPAQSVTVKDSLRSEFDLSSVKLSGITLANQNIVTPEIPLSLSPFAAVVDFRPAFNLLINVGAMLDNSNNTLSWTFQSIDPSTGLPPTDPTVGFLPPGTQGSLLFNVAAKPVETNTILQNAAVVVFDNNTPINTPIWTNTVDTTPPSSSVTPLPSTESDGSFSVSWAGADLGSGIGSYTIYVSDNGGPFVPWQSNVTTTEAKYTGLVGHTYGFYSIATDQVGNVESAKTSAEATTTVQGSSSCTPDVSSQIAVTGGGFRYNHATNSFVQTITLTNNSTAVSAMSLVLDNLTPSVTLSSAGGTTQCNAPQGSPWIAVPGTLATGQSISVPINFADPNKVGIQYSTRVLAGPGQQ